MMNKKELKEEARRGFKLSKLIDVELLLELLLLGDTVALDKIRTKYLKMRADSEAKMAEIDLATAEGLNTMISEFRHPVRSKIKRVEDLDNE